MVDSEDEIRPKVGLLNYWTTGLLDYWTIGQLDFELLNYWTTGLFFTPRRLDNWTTKLMNYWTIYNNTVLDECSLHVGTSVRPIYCFRVNILLCISKSNKILYV